MRGHPRANGSTSRWKKLSTYTQARSPPPRTLPPDTGGGNGDEEGRVDNQRNTPHNTPLTVQLTVATSRDQAPKVPPALWQHVADQNRQYEVREPIADEWVDALPVDEWPDGAKLGELMANVGIDKRDHPRHSAAFSAALRGAQWERRRANGGNRWHPPRG